MSGRKRPAEGTQSKSTLKRVKKSVPGDHMTELCHECRVFGGQCPGQRCLHFQDHNKYKDHLQELTTSLYYHDSLSVILNFQGTTHIPDVREVIRNTERALKKPEMHSYKLEGKMLTPPTVMLIDISCPECAKCASEIRKVATGQVLSMHMNIAAVNSKSKRQKKKFPPLTDERRSVMNHFMRNVCALQNISGGGCIIVHFVGKEEGDPGTYIGGFDEMVNTKLNGLLPPGELFFNNFKRKRLEDHGYAIQFDVASSSTLSIMDMKTKLPLDDCLLELDLASLGTFMKVLSSRSQKKRVKQTEHFTKVDNLHESRHVQLKKFPEGNHVVSNTDIADIIWDRLKLGENISAFAKLEEGGTYYCGISETVRDLTRYQTKCSEVSGIPIENRHESNLKTILKEKIDTEMVAVTEKFDVDTMRISVSIDTKDHERKRILVVKVPAYPGLVFYDKRGPVSYKYDEDGKVVRRLELEEWCEVLKRHLNI